MTEIRTWAVGFCVAAIGCALLQMLCPEGTLKKMFMMLTALFLFCCLISPVRSLVSSIGDLFSLSSADASVPQALDETTDKQITAVLETTLLGHAQELLADHGITVRRVEIQRDKEHEDSIYIKSVKVVLDKADHPVSADVYRLLEQAWGTAVEVYYVD